MKCQWISHIRLIKTLVTVTVWQHFCVQLKSWGLKRADGESKTSIIETRRDGRDQNSPHFSPSHVAASLLTVPVLAGLSKLAVSNPYIYLHMYKTSLLCSTKVRITYGVTALLAKIRYGIFHMIMDKAVLSQTTSDSPT